MGVLLAALGATVALGVVRHLIGDSTLVGEAVAAVLVPVGTAIGWSIPRTTAPLVIRWGLAPLAIVLAAAAGWSLGRWGRTRGRGPLLAFVLVSLVGVWAGPPENDHTIAAVGAAAGALLVCSIWRARMGVVEGLIDCTVVVWAALGAGAGKFHPTIAGLLCLGLLPLGVLLPEGTVRNLLERPKGFAVLLGVHTAIVLVAARVYAARWPDLGGLLCVVAASLLAVALLPVTRLGRGLAERP
jgi:hypothetical protein